MKKVKYFLLTIILNFIFGFLLTYHFSNRSFKTLEQYVDSEANKVLSTIVNKIVLEEVTSQVNFEKLFQISKDKNGSIQTIDFDSLAVNDILSFVTNSVENNLNMLETGKLDLNNFNLGYRPPYEMRSKGIIALIPLGVSLNNFFLSNFGPKIPVKLRKIGSVSTNLNTVVKDYGINNVLITLSVHISVSEVVNVPFNSKKVTVENDIPIAIKVIQGSIPEYYGSIINKSSPILSSNVDN